MSKDLNKQLNLLNKLNNKYKKPNMVSPEFLKLFNLIEHNSNSFFITGKAGTGKSTFLKQFKANTRKKTVVLAPTGLSALNVNGQTIHSFFRFPPKIIEKKDIKIVSNNKIYKKIEAIIIDEISMVRADIMDGMDLFLRKNGKNSNLPFGGIKLIMFGDLYQLPPVVVRTEQILNDLYDSPYFFSSKAIKKINLQTVELNKVYRQNEADFIKLLDNIRTKTDLDSTIKILNEKIKYNEITPEHVLLTSTNKIANRINYIKLSLLNSKLINYTAEIQGDFNVRQAPISQIVNLKIGAKVMLTRNDPHGQFVNGSLGMVTELEENLITLRLDSGILVGVERFNWDKVKYFYEDSTDKIKNEVVARFTQFPIKLAYAMTIHKSQGQTFSKVCIDLSTGAFTHGQTYVALSRCKSINGLILKKPLIKKDIILDNRVVDFLQNGNAKRGLNKFF